MVDSREDAAMKNLARIQLCLLLLVFSACTQQPTPSSTGQPTEQVISTFEDVEKALQAHKKRIDAQVMRIPELRRELAALQQAQSELLKAKGKAGEEAIKPLLVPATSPTPKPQALPVYDKQAFSKNEQQKLEQLEMEIKGTQLQVPLVLEFETKIATAKACIAKLKSL